MVTIRGRLVRSGVVTELSLEDGLKSMSAKQGRVLEMSPMLAHLPIAWENHISTLPNQPTLLSGEPKTTV